MGTLPEQIGRYVIKGMLGKGGMASVYHGRDPHFERDVAIKVLPREFLHDANFRARFEQEARTVAALEHPAIVPVHDFGEQDGQPYLVMRHMSGGTLADRIQQGPLPLRDVVRITERIADALQAAHQAGIIHRDLKPSNILFDHRGHPYIADFGIAKVTESSAALTGTGMVGTPAYMAPEMVQKGGLTHLVDVYALGITIFQMLTGRLPFDADTPAGMIMAHMAASVPNIREWQPDLPEGVTWVIEQAMAKDPAKRYQGTEALAADLAKAAAGEVWDTGATVVDMPVEERDVKTLHIPDAAIPMETRGAGTPLLPKVERERRMPALGPVHFLGMGGGVLAIAAAVLFGTGIISLGGRPEPTAEPTQPPTQAAEVVPIVDQTEEPTPTPATLQPLIQILYGTSLGKVGGQTEFAALPATQPLNVGDTIQTGADSAALLTFGSGVSAEVHPGTEITLAELIETAGILKVELGQANGVTYHFIHQAEDADVEYSVRTPVAAATATGTEFWVMETDKGWCFLPTDGSIEIDVGELDDDMADNYLVHSSQGMGWLVPVSGDVVPCQPDPELSLLTDGSSAVGAPTATPTVASGGVSTGRCGNGTCDTATENSDLCPADCSCRDNGVCEAGEGSGCRDCGSAAGGCSAPCSDSSQCAGGLSCAGGFCWGASCEQGTTPAPQPEDPGQPIDCSAQGQVCNLDPQFGACPAGYSCAGPYDEFNYGNCAKPGCP